MTEMRDELLERVVDELRTLPAADEAAVRRIVLAASEDENAMAAGRQGRQTHGRRLVVRVGTWIHSRIPLAAAAGLALGAGLTGYAIRGGSTSTRPEIVSPAPAESVTLAAAIPVANRSLPALVPTQFVLEAPNASRATLVGDFNGWDAGRTPLVRDPSSGIWTVMVPLTPGRHVYAFMVDDSAWTLDPRAPTAQDPDFGTPSSVVLVGTP